MDEREKKKLLEFQKKLKEKQSAETISLREQIFPSIKKEDTTPKLDLKTFKQQVIKEEKAFKQRYGMSKTEYSNLQKTLRAPLGKFTPTFVRKVTTKGISGETKTTLQEFGTFRPPFKPGKLGDNLIGMTIEEKMKLYGVGYSPSPTADEKKGRKESAKKGQQVDDIADTDLFDTGKGTTEAGEYSFKEISKERDVAQRGARELTDVQRVKLQGTVFENTATVSLDTLQEMSESLQDSIEKFGESSTNRIERIAADPNASPALKKKAQTFISEQNIKTANKIGVVKEMKSSVDEVIKDIVTTENKKVLDKIAKGAFKSKELDKLTKNIAGIQDRLLTPPEMKQLVQQRSMSVTDPITGKTQIGTAGAETISLSRRLEEMSDFDRLLSDEKSFERWFKKYTSSAKIKDTATEADLKALKQQIRYAINTAGGLEGGKQPAVVVEEIIQDWEASRFDTTYRKKMQRFNWDVTEFSPEFDDTVVRNVDAKGNVFYTEPKNVVRDYEAAKIIEESKEKITNLEGAFKGERFSKFGKLERTETGKIIPFSGADEDALKIGDLTPKERSKFRIQPTPQVDEAGQVVFSEEKIASVEKVKAKQKVLPIFSEKVRSVHGGQGITMTHKIVEPTGTFKQKISAKKQAKIISKKGAPLIDKEAVAKADVFKSDIPQTAGPGDDLKFYMETTEFEKGQGTVAGTDITKFTKGTGSKTEVPKGYFTEKEIKSGAKSLGITDMSAYNIKQIKKHLTESRLPQGVDPKKIPKTMINPPLSIASEEKGSGIPAKGDPIRGIIKAERDASGNIIPSKIKAGADFKFGYKSIVAAGGELPAIVQKTKIGGFKAKPVVTETEFHKYLTTLNPLGKPEKKVQAGVGEVLKRFSKDISRAAGIAPLLDKDYGLRTGATFGDVFKGMQAEAAQIKDIKKAATEKYLSLPDEKIIKTSKTPDTLKGQVQAKDIKYDDDYAKGFSSVTKKTSVEEKKALKKYETLVGGKVKGNKKIRWDTSRQEYTQKVRVGYGHPPQIVPNRGKIEQGLRAKMAKTKTPLSPSVGLLHPKNLEILAESGKLGDEFKGKTHLFKSNVERKKINKGFQQELSKTLSIPQPAKEEFKHLFKSDYSKTSKIKTEQYMKEIAFEAYQLTPGRQAGAIKLSDPLNKIMSNVSPSQFSKVLTSYSKKMSGIDIGNTVVKGMPSKKALEKVARFQMVTDYKASMKAAGLEKDYIKAKPLIEEFKKAFKLIGKKG